jgi:hypothetical protein
MCCVVRLLMAGQGIKGEACKSGTDKTHGFGADVCRRDGPHPRLNRGV